MSDWIAYLEAEPKSEPFLSITAAWKADKARLAAAEALLREIREDAPHFGMPTTRIDAFLAAYSASLNMEPAPDGSRVLCVADQPDGAA